MQLTRSFTQQLIHASYAYSFLLITCLLIAYKPLTKLLPIPYQSLTNSAYSLLFLYFNAVLPHVFKPLGSAQWKKDPIAQNYPSLSVSQSVSPQLLESCRLQWRSKDFDIQVYSSYSSSSISLGSSRVCQSILHSPLLLDVRSPLAPLLHPSLGVVSLLQFLSPQSPL